MRWFTKKNKSAHLSNQNIRNENTARKIKALPLFGGPAYEEFDPYNNKNFRVAPATGNYGSINSNNIIIPNNARNEIMMGNIHNGNNMINFKNKSPNSKYESTYKRYHKKNTFNKYLKGKPHPFTRKPINMNTLKFYKAHVKHNWKPNRTFKNGSIEKKYIKIIDIIMKGEKFDLTQIKNVLKTGTNKEKIQMRKILIKAIDLIEKNYTKLTGLTFTLLTVPYMFRVVIHPYGKKGEFLNLLLGQLKTLLMYVPDVEILEHNPMFKNMINEPVDIIIENESVSP